MDLFVLSDGALEGAQGACLVMCIFLVGERSSGCTGILYRSAGPEPPMQALPYMPALIGQASRAGWCSEMQGDAPLPYLASSCSGQVLTIVAALSWALGPMRMSRGPSWAKLQPDMHYAILLQPRRAARAEGELAKYWVPESAFSRVELHGGHPNIHEHCIYAPAGGCRWQ